MDNLESVEKHFTHKLNLDTKLEQAGYAMVTLYPTIVSIKMKDFSCASISELMSRSQGSDAWPFSKSRLKKPE